MPPRKKSPPVKIEDDVRAQIAKTVRSVEVSTDALANEGNAAEALELAAHQQVGEGFDVWVSAKAEGAAFNLRIRGKVFHGAHSRAQQRTVLKIPTILREAVEAHHFAKTNRILRLKA